MFISTTFLKRLSRRVVHFRIIGLGLFSLLGLPSCTTLPIADNTPEPSRLGQEFPTYHTLSDPESTPPSFTEPTGELTLRAALAAALIHSPELAVFSWEIRARDAQAIQAGQLPNPAFGLEVEEFGGDGERSAFDSADTTFRLSQLFELGGKRTKRQRVATLERDLASWDYEAHRLDVFTAVTKAFIATLAAQEQIALGEEKVRLAKEMLQVVVQQVKSGAVSPVEETLARAALVRSQVELSQYRREQTADHLLLAATWGSTVVTFSAVVGDLEPIVPPPTLNALLPHLLNNPDIARWWVEKEQRQAVLQLEQAHRLPDVEAGIGGRYINADDTAALIFEVSLPLLLFDRNQGGIQEATARLAKASAEQHEAEIQSRTALAAAHQSLSSAFEQATALRDSFLPQARTALEEASRAYQSGRLRYLDVLEARRTLFELRSQYVEALASYHTAAADVERLIAEPLGPLTNRTR